MKFKVQLKHVRPISVECTDVVFPGCWVAFYDHDALIVAYPAEAVENVERIREEK